MSKQNHKWGERVSAAGAHRQTCIECGCVKRSFKYAYPRYHMPGDPHIYKNTPSCPGKPVDYCREHDMGVVHDGSVVCCAECRKPIPPDEIPEMLKYSTLYYGDRTA